MAKEKTKLQKHLEELGESTSGGAHDAVTFSGKGLNFLRDLFKGEKPKNERLEDDEEDEDEDDDDLEKNDPNGGDWDEEEEDKDDPGQEGPEEIITNKGKRVKGTGAVKKHYFEDDEENILQKSFDDFEEDYDDVLDASPALEGLAKSMRSMAKSQSASVAELKEQNLLLGKAVRELLKSQAALAADLELIKKQPAGSPASGFVVLNKGEAGSKGRKLSKSEIMDVVTDAMNSELVDSRALAVLGRLHTDAELTNYVNQLPAEVRAKL